VRHTKKANRTFKHTCPTGKRVWFLSTHGQMLKKPKEPIFLPSLGRKMLKTHCTFIENPAGRNDIFSKVPASA